MRCLLMLTIVSILLSGAAVALADDGDAAKFETLLTSQGEAREVLVKAYRERGASALADLIAARDERLHRQSNRATPGELWESLQIEITKLNAAIDEVGGARYCSASGLYWYTDLKAAQDESARTNKPILALRMLGKLNEEFSCANSRFFRTTLYANKEISSVLRDKFVLHWASVRPVPKVTIDFGDGRKLERTLTGNSAHYLLDSTGRPLDGLPGLYGPQAFQSWLGRADVLFQQYQATSPYDRSALLQQYHEARLEDLAKEWADDVAALTQNNTRAIQPTASQDPPTQAPDAQQANKIAIPKRDVEASLVREIAFTHQLPPSMDSLSDEQWNRIAELHHDQATLDPATIKVMRAENAAGDAGRRSRSKALVEDPLLKIVRCLETSISLDTVRNEYVLHRQLHQWFVAGEAAADINVLNEQVYTKLFLTPSSDPWLGLVQPNTYTGLTNAGIREEAPPPR